MKKLEFNAGNNENKHQCTSRKKGDWIIYECPLCPDYKRAFNLKTGVMKSIISPDNYILHNGAWSKPGLDQTISLN